MKPIHHGGLALSAALAAALVAGCSSSTDPADAAPNNAAPTVAPAVEVTSPEPRLALTYDGGILVVDATELDVVANLPLDGFNRLGPAGDDRHVFVSTTGGFRALDTGSWSDAHGDHSHHFAGTPALTDLTFPADKPGHVSPTRAPPHCSTTAQEISHCSIPTNSTPAAHAPTRIRTRHPTPTTVSPCHSKTDHSSSPRATAKAAAALFFSTSTATKSREPTSAPESTAKRRSRLGRVRM